MTGSRVTKRYAKALFEAAQASDQIDRIENDLNQLKEVIEKSPDFSVLLQSPVIGSAEKRKMIRQMFEKKLQPLSFNFLNLLLNKGREKILPEIIEYFFRLIDESRGIIRGQLLATHPLSVTQLEGLKKHLDRITGKNVQLNQQVDPSLIGGFVVRMDDTVIDSSIRNQLVKMKEYLISNK